MIVSKFANIVLGLIVVHCIIIKIGILEYCFFSEAFHYLPSSKYSIYTALVADTGEVV